MQKVAHLLQSRLTLGESVVQGGPLGFKLLYAGILICHDGKHVDIMQRPLSRLIRYPLGEHELLRPHTLLRDLLEETPSPIRGVGALPRGSPAGPHGPKHAQKASENSQPKSIPRSDSSAPARIP